MPFGIDLKSFILGLIAVYVIKYLMTFVQAKRTPSEG